ncbi:MAG: IS5/IS1182 family transposase, partial [Sandaracinus sp.]|nr:IS5/IS1182 family transposase [Sandaracinus sp.]
MASLRWEPTEDLTAQERMLLKTVKRTKKLFGFLRMHRLELFDEAFQEELAAVYRKTGAGKTAHPPAFMAMVVLLQAYTKTSDAEAVQQCVVDLRWQMVLGCLGATKPPFSQGALHDFRHRLIKHDLDRRLLERTSELARETRAFDFKKLPKS